MKIGRILTLLFVAVWLAGSYACAEGSFKTRALWVDPPSFTSAEAADKLIAKCQRAGINMILPNVMMHNSLFYKSSHYLHKVVADDKFDPLAYLIRRAHDANIQVHPWFCVYYECAEGAEPARKDWLCRDPEGKIISPQYFLSPGNPEVNPYLLSVIKDVLAYDIDGIHLDYIRYSGTQYDYSEPARKRFSDKWGFDPINFLDSPEKIVAPELDPFPIRVLRTKRSSERPWEVTWIERLFDIVGLGFASITEKPENVNALHAPGLLVLSNYYDVTPEMASALERYVRRGGNILWTDAPTAELRKQNSPISRLVGMEDGRWIADRMISVRKAEDHPLVKYLPHEPFKTFANCALKSAGAHVIANMDSGEPAVSINRVGKGQVILLGFNAGRAGNRDMSGLVRGIAEWLRQEDKVAPGPDVMGTKRALWIRWRAEQITDLVQGVHDMAKAKDQKIAISTSGGPNPDDYYVVYRDTRHWMLKGLTDLDFPMNYTDDPAEFRRILKDQLLATPPGFQSHVNPGISIYTVKTVDGKRTSIPQDPSVVEKELRTAQELGHQGFILFVSGSLTDELADVVAKFAQ